MRKCRTKANFYWDKQKETFIFNLKDFSVFVGAKTAERLFIACIASETLNSERLTDSLPIGNLLLLAVCNSSIQG